MTVPTKMDQLPPGLAEIVGALALELTKAEVSADQVGRVLLGILPTLSKRTGSRDLIEQRQIESSDTDNTFPVAKVALKKFLVTKNALEESVFQNNLRVVIKVGLPNQKTSITIPIDLANQALTKYGSVRARNKIINSIFMQCPKNIKNRSQWVSLALVEQILK